MMKIVLTAVSMLIAAVSVQADDATQCSACPHAKKVAQAQVVNPKAQKAVTDSSSGDGSSDSSGQCSGDSCTNADGSNASSGNSSGGGDSDSSGTSDDSTNGYGG